MPGTASSGATAAWSSSTRRRDRLTFADHTQLAYDQALVATGGDAAAARSAGCGSARRASAADAD